MSVAHCFQASEVFDPATVFPDCAVEALRKLGNVYRLDFHIDFAGHDFALEVSLSPSFMWSFLAALRIRVKAAGANAVDRFGKKR